MSTFKFTSKYVIIFYMKPFKLKHTVSTFPFKSPLKQTTSIAPKQRSKEVTDALKPKKGTAAEAIVNAIVPETGKEALGMMATAGVLRTLPAASRKLASTAKRIYSSGGGKYLNKLKGFLGV